MDKPVFEKKKKHIADGIKIHMPNWLDTYILSMQGNPGNFCMWYPESWKFFACGIRIPGPLNPEYSCKNPASHLQSKSTEKIWNSVIGILKLRRQAPNPRLSSIPSHVATYIIVAQ